MSQLRDLDAFVCKLKSVRSAGDMENLLDSITREMGFHGFSLVQHVRNFSRSNDRFLAVSNLSLDWIDYFLDNRLDLDEPVYAAAHRTPVGFRFSDVPSLIRLTDRQRQVQEARARESITDGFCVPAHVPGEATASCSFVVRDNRLLPANNLAMAQAVGNFAYEAARQLLRSGVCFVGPARFTGLPTQTPSPSQPNPTLTTRQLECVVLVARGKTDWEIARILELHEQTVTDHVNEARQRLGVANRHELVVRALFHGHLAFEDVIH